MGKGRYHSKFARADQPAVTAPNSTYDCCRNCGARADSKFCPQCGQNTKVGIPRIHELLHDGMGALFSYDGKIWRTLAVLISKPGQLTVDYIDGKRVRYLTPFQLFFWLQAIAFVAHRLFFVGDPHLIDLKSKALLVVGAVLTVGIAFMNVGKKLQFLIHLITATHIWSFLMLVLLVEYSLVPLLAHPLVLSGVLPKNTDVGPYLTLIAQIVLSLYLWLSLQRVYGLSWFWSTAQTAGLFGLYRVAALVIDKTWG